MARDPRQISRIGDEHKTQSRFDVAMTRGLTSLVGRVQELALLHERWARVKEGFGSIAGFLETRAGFLPGDTSQAKFAKYVCPLSSVAVSSAAV